MIFTQIELKNFFSVAECISVNLKNQGLVLIDGVNGVGKSTIFEAILWCLWGKTVRGQNTDDVVNLRANSDCWVRMHIEQDDKVYVVERYRKDKEHKNKVLFMQYTDEGPADMTQGTPTLTQETIDEFLGIDYETFTQGPMMPQGSLKRFSRMTDKEQKEVLETAIQVKILARAHAKVKEVGKDIDTKITLKESELDAVKSRIALRQEQMNAHISNVESWKIRAIYTNVRHARHSIRRLNEEYEEVWEEVGKEIPSLNDALAAEFRVKEIAHNCEKQWENRLTEAGITANNLSAEISKHYDTRDRINKNISQVKFTKTGKCPKCFQDVSQEHLDLCLKDLNDQRQEALDAAAELQPSYDAAQEEVENLKAKRIKELATSREYVERATLRVQAIKHQQDTRDRALSLLKTLENGIEEANEAHRLNKAEQLKDLDSLATRSNGCAAYIEADTAEANGICDDITVLRSKKEYVNFWAKGFSNVGLKSLILESVTPFMNKQAQTYVHNLTDGEIQIEFNTQKKNKDGSIREDFHVLVTNKYGANTYKGNSGGEKSRADLTINFTISDLIASRAKKSFPQRFFDEPFESLDEAGIEAVMDMLGRLTHQCGTIMVITHQPVMKGMFDKVITLEKHLGVTKIVN